MDEQVQTEELTSTDKLVHFVVGSGPTYSPTSTSSCSEGSTEEDDDDEEDGGHVKVGVCAMAKKSRSRPMQEILERLVRFKHIETFIFDEDVILNQPVENWPICDCLISFHSKGFPLEKAAQYVELRKPFVINDLKAQYALQDRAKVYQILSYYGIDKPRYAIMNRDPAAEGMCNFVEADDYIEVNGAVFHKPFVEKPVSAEDHNVYIYFPSSAGGGSQRLFRKIGSRSSVYSPISTVRKVGSFMYEEFMPTDGTDVKVYTVGPDYAHAEARKSPALDGKVERDKDGKEIRYPVLLSAKEKMIARTVCLAFKQNVCGFDLLRANGKSYVCDVNGFSFVKTSPKYYDDCAKILGNMILRELAPTLHIPYSITYQAEDVPIVPTTSGTMMELRCVVAVMRHGDRTPKQKMKMEVKHKMFFNLFEKYGGPQSNHLKLKHPKQLQEVLDIARFLLSEATSHPDSDVEEKRSKLEQLKSVLEMYGHFSGINRKVQFKYQPHGCPSQLPQEEDKIGDKVDKSVKKKKKDKSSSSSSNDSSPKGEPSLVLILKWGGELTPAGKIQAEELGKAFRCMYPGGRVSLLLIPPVLGDYGQSPGLGLLRLHSTFRHDLKIYASDEGRVQMTAAAFAKGFLALEGELTPILVQMVKSANMNGLLDNENQSLKLHNEVKERLQEMMNVDRPFTEEDYEKFVPMKAVSVLKAMQFIGNPRVACTKIHSMMAKLMDRIKELKGDPKASDMKLYHGESWELMNRRWGKLVKDFLRPDGFYDISKVPDIYDCIKYDLQHNSKVLRFPDTEELHAITKAMADIVIPQEYGITLDEKLSIGRSICSPLLRKILADFQRNEDGDEPTRLDSRYSEGVTSPQRHVKTRLYFTSESHIHSLLTAFRYGDLCNSSKDEQWSRAMDYVSSVSELNYLSQIVIMLYEDPTKAVNSEERFHVELHFSPGAYTVGQNKEFLAGRGYRPQLGEKKQKAEMETNQKMVREVLTSPSQLHLIETVPEEEPSQVDGKLQSRLLSPTPTAARPHLTPLVLSSTSDYTCKDRSSRSLIRRTLQPVHQEVEEPSSSSEMEDSNNSDIKRLGGKITRRSAERLKPFPNKQIPSLNRSSEMVSNLESSKDSQPFTAVGGVAREHSEPMADLCDPSKYDNIGNNFLHQSAKQLSETTLIPKSDVLLVSDKYSQANQAALESISSPGLAVGRANDSSPNIQDGMESIIGDIGNSVKAQDFTPDYSLANHIVQLQRPSPNQARKNSAEDPVSCSDQPSEIMFPEAQDLNTDVPIRSSLTSSSSPSSVTSHYDSCTASISSSPIRGSKDFTLTGHALPVANSNQTATEIQLTQQQFLEEEVPTSDWTRGRAVSSNGTEGGSRRRHQSTSSVEGSSVCDLACCGNGDNPPPPNMRQQQQEQQQQHFDFLSSNIVLPTNNQAMESNLAGSTSFETPDTSFNQSSPSTSSMERTAKESRSRSLETLQKNHHHHQGREHHHHHHHHHREHGRHKRNSFLALFHSPNSESLDGWRVPSLRPLETLHNSLTLSQLERFIKSTTDSFTKTPDPMQVGS